VGERRLIVIGVIEATERGELEQAKEERNVSVFGEEAGLRKNSPGNLLLSEDLWPTVSIDFQYRLRRQSDEGRFGVVFRNF